MVLAACDSDAPDDSQSEAGAETDGDGEDAADSGDEPSGGRIDMALNVLPRTLDPNDDSGLQMFRIWRLLYDSLIEVDSEGVPQPALATEWRLVEDTLWEFDLREGVTFHNGEEFTAEAVVATAEHVLAEETGSSWAQRLVAIESVEAVDDYTVQIRTSTPSPLLLKNLAVMFIFPPEHLAAEGSMGQNPVGTGPFQLAEFQADQSLLVERFDDHWRGTTEVDELNIIQMQEASSRVSALQTEEVDVSFLIPPEQVETLEGGGMQTDTGILGQSYLLMLYTNDEILSDTRVRQALNYATDVESINESLFFGEGRILEGQMVGPNSTGYHPDLEPYPYDPDQAMALLEEAGYPDGFSIEYNAPSGRYFKDREIAEAVCEQWSRVNVECQLNFLESSVWVESLQDGSLGPISMAGWQTAPQLDLEVPMVNFVDSSPRDIASIPELNQLFEEAQTTVDEDARLETLHELAEAIREDPPVVFLVENIDITALQPYVEGFESFPNYTFDPLTIRLTE